MELRDALTQITEIRLQMARTEVFRGYRALPVAFSGVLAIVAAGIQAVWIPDPGRTLSAYLALWIGTAVLSATAAGLEMFARSRRDSSAWRREVTWLAVEQFLPCLVVGGCLTYMLVRFAPESLWLLPGLWQLFYCLGIFASCRLLPRSTFGVAVYYLGSGLITLAWARGAHAFSPWSMGLSFGVGQLLAALILYTALERDDVDG